MSENHDELESREEHSHHSHHRHRHRRHRHRHRKNSLHISDEMEMSLRKLLIVALIALALYAALGAIRQWENSRDFLREGTPAAEPILQPTDSGYRARLGLHTYLFMGVDRDGPAEYTYDDGGQVDVLMVLVTDDVNKTWQILELNRDTIADVTQLGVTGQVIGHRSEQLALAHSYGDGLNKSCLNVLGVVSKLLDGQKIDGYAALNMGGISILNDALGGVTVTIHTDFSGVDDSLVLGETITLNGAQAERFVRSRKGVDDGSNLARMERQRQYLHGLREKLPELESSDVLSAYSEAKDYIVSNLDGNDFANLLNTIKNYAELPAQSFLGEARLENDLMAFYLDEENRREVVLKMFYEEK